MTIFTTFLDRIWFRYNKPVYGITSPRLNSNHIASQRKYYNDFAFPLGALLFNLNGFSLQKMAYFISKKICIHSNNWKRFTNLHQYEWYSLRSFQKSHVIRILPKIFLPRVSISYRQLQLSSPNSCKYFKIHVVRFKYFHYSCLFIYFLCFFFTIKKK